MSIYAYTRVSTAIQANDGESLEAQARQLTGWAMMQGVELTTIYEERAVSGSIPIKERPAGDTMWRSLRKGDTIVAAKLDRMFRSALDALQMVEELKGMGVSLVLLDLGGDVVSNGMSKMFLTITAAFAEAERDRIRERIVSAKRDGKARGRYLGGIVPYGFRAVEGALVAEPAEQAVIAAAKALRTEGKPLRTIQAQLVADHGRKLSLDALSRVLTD